MIDDFVSITHGVGQSLVVVKGEFDTDKARDLLNRVIAAVPIEHQLTLDLTHVPFISHGEQLLRQLARRHPIVRVVAPDGSFAAYLLDLARIPGVLVHPE